jgi:hypothetical protein
MGSGICSVDPPVRSCTSKGASSVNMRASDPGGASASQVTCCASAVIPHVALTEHGLSAGRSMGVTPPVSRVTERLSIWDRELLVDINRAYILEGIQFGFMIIDSVCDFHSTFSRNYRSVLCDERVKVELQLIKEVKLGRYIIVEDPPDVVSSLGAVPKAGSDKIRVIHDLSRPYIVHTI